MQKRIIAKKNNKDSAKKITDRISRIEGQLRGIRKMIGEKKDCINIITQISAVKEAVSKLGVELLKNDFICKVNEQKKISGEYIETIFKIK
jgi:DNA-binding FrmR family transcriptional regulator